MSTFWVFVNFLDYYNRYKVENLSVNLTFNDLSNDISHVVVTQNFIICTCLRYVDILGFCRFSPHVQGMSTYYNIRVHKTEKLYTYSSFFSLYTVSYSLVVFVTLTKVKTMLNW